MTDVLRDSCQSLLDRALDEDLGIVVEINNPEALIQRIHTARKALNDPRYDSIMLCRTSNPEELFLIKKSVELD